MHRFCAAGGIGYTVRRAKVDNAAGIYLEHRACLGFIDKDGNVFFKLECFLLHVKQQVSLRLIKDANHIAKKTQELHLGKIGVL